MHEHIWDDMKHFDEVWRRVRPSHRPSPPGPGFGPPPGFPPPPGHRPPQDFPPPPPRLGKKPCCRSFRFNPHGYRR